MHKICAINIRPDDRESISYLRDIIAKLKALNVTVMLPEYDILRETELSEYITKKENFLSKPDLAVSIGGDGTFLYTVRLFPGSIPILGINKGRVGFLTEFMPEEALNSIENIIGGHYEKLEREMLEASHTRNGKQISRLDFLNDAYIFRGSHRPVRLSLEIDGHFLTSFLGDGLIISTSTGSTAYSLAAGGPIINPVIKGIFLIIPICPHSLAIRPLIIPSTSSIKISVDPDYEDTVITADGYGSVKVERDDAIIVTGSSIKTNIVSKPGNNFYEILKKKFKWGI